jgi:hypothetical protein
LWNLRGQLVCEPFEGHDGDVESVALVLMVNGLLVAVLTQNYDYGICEGSLFVNLLKVIKVVLYSSPLVEIVNRSLVLATIKQFDCGICKERLLVSLFAVMREN